RDHPGQPRSVDCASDGAADGIARRTSTIYAASYAFLRSSITILFISSIACITACDLAGFGSLISLPRAAGITCHDNPYLSFTQPHRLFSPPADSFSHSSSTSDCVSQLTKKEIASVNLNFGPAFRPMNC